MTFAEMETEVIRITNRPELTDEIRRALNAAILKFHKLDDFWRDRVDGVINFPSASYQHSTSVAGFVGFRKVHHIAPLGSTGLEARPLEYVPNAEDAFCKDCIRKTNIYWLAGNTLNMRTSQSVSSFRFSYYANPTILPIGVYSGWMALQHPYAIIDEAAARVFGSIGFRDSQSFYERKVGLPHLAGGATGHCKEILMAQLMPEDL